MSDSNGTRRIFQQIPMDSIGFQRIPMDFTGKNMKKSENVGKSRKFMIRFFMIRLWPFPSNQRTPQPLTLATLSFLTALFFGNCLSNFAAPVADPWISKIILSKLAQFSKFDGQKRESLSFLFVVFLSDVGTVLFFVKVFKTKCIFFSKIFS